MPKRKHGTGHISEKGYIRLWNNQSGGLEFEHRRVWEETHGKKVPGGYSLHHKNGNKQDNRIENLELVDALTHKRLHSGCKLVDGVWWKRCAKCEKVKEINKENWYFSKEDWVMYGMCRPCRVQTVVERKRQLRLKQVT